MLLRYMKCLGGKAARFKQGLCHQREAIKKSSESSVGSPLSGFLAVPDLARCHVSLFLCFSLSLFLSLSLPLFQFLGSLPLNASRTLFSLISLLSSSEALQAGALPAGKGAGAAQRPQPRGEHLTALHPSENLEKILKKS